MWSPLRSARTNDDYPSRKYLAEESPDHAVELLRPLQRCEMAHARQEDQFRSGNAPSEIFGMFGFDKLIMLALYDRDGHMDISHIARRIIGLRLHHLADRGGKCLELVRRGRQLGIVLGVSAQTPVEDRTGLRDFLCAAGIHVAAKEKYTCNT